jgi:hypothetical protein
MYIAYVDESGDPGRNTAVTKHFTLSGIIVADSNWKPFYDRVKAFRKGLKRDFGITLKDDLRAKDLWNNSGDFKKLKLSYADRRRIFRRTAEFLRYSQEVTILNISINKGASQLPSTGKIGEIAWTLFLQRFENWLVASKNKELGIVVNDEGYEKLTRMVSRRMQVYNPIPSHYGGYYQAPLVKIIEDPFSRHSQYSYFVQLADISAYLARLRYDHTSKQAKWGIHKFYKRIKPRYILEASKKDNYGFVLYP